MFFSENKDTYLYTSEEQNYLIDSTLDQLEDELELQFFYRISRNFFININAIKDMVSYMVSRLKLN